MLLLLVFVPALVLVQAQTKVPVQLGDSVLLRCSAEVEMTRWYMQIHDGLQTCISQSVTNSTSFFTVARFQKFSAQGRHLQIKNLTEQDLRSYSCVTRKDWRKDQGVEVFTVHERYVLTSAASPAMAEFPQTEPGPFDLPDEPEEPKEPEPVEYEDDCEVLLIRIVLFTVLFCVLLSVHVLALVPLFCLMKRMKRSVSDPQCETTVQFENIQEENTHDYEN